MQTEPLAQPHTLVEAIRYFGDPDVALRTMVELSWPDGVYCPICGRTDPRFISTRRIIKVSRAEYEKAEKRH